MTTTTPLDELGPVDFMIVEFPAGTSHFTGEMARGADQARRRRHHPDHRHPRARQGRGRLRSRPWSSKTSHELGPLQVLEAELAELLAEEDVEHLAAAMDPGSVAGVLMYENTWAAPFASAARRSGGQLIANGRIPIQAIIAAVEADAELEQEGD